MMAGLDSSSFVVASRIDSFYPRFPAVSGEPGQGMADRMVRLRGVVKNRPRLNPTALPAAHALVTPQGVPPLTDRCHDPSGARAVSRPSADHTPGGAR
jgi:hypothetical protein